MSLALASYSAASSPPTPLHLTAAFSTPPLPREQRISKQQKEGATDRPSAATIRMRGWLYSPSSRIRSTRITRCGARSSKQIYQKNERYILSSTVSAISSYTYTQGKARARGRMPELVARGRDDALYKAGVQGQEGHTRHVLSHNDSIQINRFGR
jgi:hypothetical protein